MSLFITFEGTEGSGKTTQISLLADALLAEGHDVNTTREPGGTEIGEALRHLLLDATVPLAAETEAYLMTAARAEHVRQVIQPALHRGTVVLCDRFYDSTYAYQGGGRGLSLDALRDMQQLAVGQCHPDLTILLDLPVEDGLLRRRGVGNGNRIDRETVEFHRRVAGYYRRAAQCEPARWHIVDATLAPDLVHTAILKHVVAQLAAVSSTWHGSEGS